MRIENRSTYLDLGSNWVRVRILLLQFHSRHAHEGTCVTPMKPTACGESATMQKYPRRRDIHMIDDK